MFENPTVNLSALRNSCAKIGLPFFWIDLGVCFCGQQHPKSQQSIPLLYPTILLYTSLFTNPTNRLTELGVEIRSTLSETLQNQTHIHMIFFSPHSDRYCHFPIYWPFLLYHPLCKTPKIYFLWDFAPTFRNRGSYIYRVKVTKKNILGSEDEDTMIGSNTSNCVPVGMASCPRWLESSATLLWETHMSQNCVCPCIVRIVLRLIDCRYV